MWLRRTGREFILKPPLRAIGLLLFSAVLCLLFFDQKITCFFSKNEPEPFDSIAMVITDLGEAGVYLALSFLGTVVFKVFSRISVKNRASHKKKYEVFLMSLIAFLFSGFVITVLKVLFGRERPYFSESCDPWVFTWFNAHWNFHSMPSGHGQVVFTLWALTHFFNWKWSWFVLIYAILIGSTRVVIFRHFPSDVLVSFAVSYLCVWWLFFRKQKKLLKENNEQL